MSESDVVSKKLRFIHVRVRGTFKWTGIRREFVEKNRIDSFWPWRFMALASSCWKMFQRYKCRKSELRFYILWPDRQGISMISYSDRIHDPNRSKWERAVIRYGSVYGHHTLPLLWAKYCFIMFRGILYFRSWYAEFAVQTLSVMRTFERSAVIP